MVNIRLVIICVKFLSKIFNFVSYYDNIKQIIIFRYARDVQNKASMFFNLNVH